MEFELTKDPNTNTVPRERLLPAWAEAKRRMSLNASSTRGDITALQWDERGPNNVGGRTRSILIDANDPNGNTIWAGSVSGGLFKSTNIAGGDPQWQAIDDLFENLAVNAIAQDPLNPNNIYFGTGEGWFNADALRGLGIWKSSDGGNTWTQLPSTTNAFFYYTQDLVVDASGVVFAATRNGGLQRSTDGGNTWTRILGSGLQGANNNSAADIEIAANGDMYCTLGVQNSGGIYKSTDSGNNWNRLSAGLPSSGFERIEIACAPSDVNRLYALFQSSSSSECLGIYRSDNAGDSWTAVDNPSAVGMSSFTRNQAWFDLICAVDPNNPDVVWIGGVDLLRSNNGGQSWTQMTQWFGGSGLPYVHADQHQIVYAPGNSSIMYFGNDGGVWRSNNGGNTIVEKNIGYNVTQFYSGAIHPNAGEDYFIGGTQDNGTQQFTQPGLNATNRAYGGDGGFAHIDEDEPNIQITATTYQNYRLTTNSWQNSTGMGSGTQDGSFINPSDYDGEANILYAAYASGQIYRISNIGAARSETAISISEFGGGRIRHLNVSPNAPNRVFVGLSNGRVVRVDNAHTANPTATRLNPSGGPGGSISCIAMENGDDNHLLVTASNYGIVSVWETYDAGGTWFNREGDLPDMPVRWALFNPNDDNQAVLATELGVWVTESLNAPNVEWVPSANGMPNTRVSMLQIRNDQTVLAATFGRGFFTTTSLELPALTVLPTQAFLTESSTSGRIDDCNGYREVQIALILNGPPAESVPVVLEIDPSSTVDVDDYVISPSNIIILPAGVIDTQYVSLRIINDGKVESIENIKVNVTLPISGRVSLGDNSQVAVTISDGLSTFNKVASDEGIKDLHQLGPDAAIYFHRGNGEILAKIENLSAHDFGCVSVEIDRAGAGSVDFWDERSDANDLASKTLLLTADNPSDNAPYRLTMYYTGDEIAGWENATGKDFFNEIEVIRSPGAISRITPVDNTPDGDIERKAPTAEALGANAVTLTTDFDGRFGGFGVGSPATPITLSGNDLDFKGEPLVDRNRLFWNVGGTYNWESFEVEKIATDGTTSLIATVTANNASTYEAFDPNPIEGENKYQLRLLTVEGDYSSSDIVIINWEATATQLGPVAPNPFTDYLDIFPGDDGVSYEVRLFDLSGKTIASDEFVSEGVYRWELADRNLSIGLYILELRTGEAEPQLFKLLKQ
ncbi:MAG: hypothetical protein AB8H47_11875 [Bacteroidia bacterium]